MKIVLVPDALEDWRCSTLGILEAIVGSRAG
jgi:hypothetical protein